jgi:hypothetical protein
MCYDFERTLYHERIDSYALDRIEESDGDKS